ncbi:hypothetical protein DMENIID0001_121780 [Sergentomyia squamirostris]
MVSGGRWVIENVLFKPQTPAGMKVMECGIYWSIPQLLLRVRQVEAGRGRPQPLDLFSGQHGQKARVKRQYMYFTLAEIPISGFSRASVSV